MGCFNKIGFYSNLPITYGEDIVLFPCYMPTRKELFDTSMIGVDGLMIPICLPIYCKYDEYGGGEEYIRDFNIELIEDVMGMDISSFVNALSDGITKDNCQNDKIYSFIEKNNFTDGVLLYTMERKDVYDTMISISNIPFYKIDNFDEGRNIGDFWLSTLGFEKYKHIDCDSYYRLDGYDGEYYVKSRGYCCPTICKNEIEIATIYHGLEEFITTWEKITSFPLSVDDSVKNMNVIDISFDATSENKYDFMSTTKYNDINKFSLYMDGSFDTLCLYEDINIYTKEYKQRFCDFAKFNRTLHKICGYYKPSSYAHQSIADKHVVDAFNVLNRCYSNIISTFENKNNTSCDE